MNVLVELLRQNESAFYGLVEGSEGTRRPASALGSVFGGDGELADMFRAADADPVGRGLLRTAFVEIASSQLWFAGREQAELADPDEHFEWSTFVTHRTADGVGIALPDDRYLDRRLSLYAIPRWPVAAPDAIRRLSLRWAGPRHLELSVAVSDCGPYIAGRCVPGSCGGICMPRWYDPPNEVNRGGWVCDCV